MKRGGIVVAVLAALLLLGLGLWWNRSRASRSAPPSPRLAVPPGEAGKAGDLQVTEQALELAEIRMARPEVRQVEEVLAVSGILQAGGDQMARVTPPGQGKVVRLAVTAGSRVRAGETLAVLESAPLARAQATHAQAAARVGALEANLGRMRELASMGEYGLPRVEESRTRAVEARRGLEAARSQRAEQGTELAEATANLKVCQDEFAIQRARLRRAESLKDLVAGQELERIRADYNKALAEVEVARARLDGARVRLQAAEQEVGLAEQGTRIAAGASARQERIYRGNYHTSRELVEAEAELRMARVDLEAAAEEVRLLGGRPGGGSRLELSSPISGTVGECSLTLGEVVDSEHVAFTVVNLERVWARLAVPPRDLARVKVGDRVVLTAESAPGKSYRGRVSGVDPMSDEATRAVYVRARLENLDASLKAGTYVKGDLVTDVRARRLTVPEGALQEHTGRPTLYVALPGHRGAFEVRHVLLGTRGQGWREVTEGLKDDEQVAVSGTFYLKSEALKSSLSDGCCGPGK